MSNYIYTIEDIYETIKTAATKEEAIEIAKEIANRRRINIYVYFRGDFITYEVGHAGYVAYQKKVRFFNK